MTASVVGSLLALLIGVAFLTAAAARWWGPETDGAARSRRVTAVLVDLFVGLAAVGDGTVSVISEPERIVVWAVGSAALVAAVALLVLRHRRDHRDV